MKGGKAKRTEKNPISKGRASMHLRTRTTGGRATTLATLIALLALALIPAAAQALSQDYALSEAGSSLSTPLAGAHADFQTKWRITADPTRLEGPENVTWARSRDVLTELPPGLLGNPAAFPKCSTSVFMEQIGAVSEPGVPFCPTDSQIGMIEPGVLGFVSIGGYRTPVFNLEPPAGSDHIVARLGFYAFFYPTFINITLDPKRGNALDATLTNIPATAPLSGSINTFWGVPTDESHDSERFNWFEALTCNGLCGSPVPSGVEPTPFMSNSTSCSPREVVTGVRSYQDPSGFDFAPTPLDETIECEGVPFEPTMSLAPTTRSPNASSGLDVNLEVPQEGLTDPEGLRTSDLKKAVVTLAQGISLNPSAADGLGSCTEEQIGVDRNEEQIANLGAGGAPVSLSFEGQSTSMLPVFASAAQVRSALEGLPNIAPGDIAVSGREGGPWTVDFQGSFSGRDVPVIMGTHSAFQMVGVKAESGTYTLGFAGDETTDLPLNANGAEVQAALEALPGIGAGGVEVIGEEAVGSFNSHPGFISHVAFRGANDGVAVPTLTAQSANLEGEVIASVNVLAEGGSEVQTHTVKQGGTLSFDEADAACPESSKVATGQITTPVLEDPIAASFYIAKQRDNPFGSLFAGYLVAKGEGVLLKLPAKIDVDPDTGQITATFDNNPQQPFEDLELHFKGGNRGLITTPSQCGTYATTYELTPWSGNAPVKGQSGFTLDQNCGAKPFAPGFHAGSTSALAGSFATFATQVTNETGAPALRSISVDLPEGVSARLAGVGTCSDQALASLPTAPSTGAGQIVAPSCPAASQIGTVVAGAGSGSPFYVRTGKVYLAGPYKGAPLSLAVLTPAVAGPFDLGNVLVRVPVTLDRKTARAHAASDPIPTMLSGIPLDLRDVRVLLDRQGFALNPTSCAPEATTGTIGGEGGASAGVSDRFQVGECAALGFKPKLALQLKGGTKRGDHPALSAILRPRPGDANLSSATVALPKSEFLDQNHIGTVCTRVQFAADQCPAASIYGSVTARTPLLDEALSGNVYLRSSDNKLPDLVMDLRGPASRPIKLEAVGRIDSVNGGIRTSFEFIPDAPVTKVTLKMKGGKKGLLQNSRNICSQAFKASAAFTAHNGRTLATQPKMQARCPKAAKAKGKGKPHGKRHG